MLYGCSTRVGTFLETLAPFRPDPHVVAGLDPVQGDDDGALGPGELAVGDWLAARLMGVACVGGDFADVGHSRSLAWLRSALAARVVGFGLEDLDAATIRLSAPRRFTQDVSRMVYACQQAGGDSFAGIRYLSRLGDDIVNWAIFEPADITDVVTEDVGADDADLRRAAEHLGLVLL